MCLQGSLIANMILGIIILKKRYPASFNRTNIHGTLDLYQLVWSAEDQHILYLQLFACRLLSLQVSYRQIFVHSISFSWHLHMHHHVCQTSGESWAEHVTQHILCTLLLHYICTLTVCAECGQWGLRGGGITCICALAYGYVLDTCIDEWMLSA